jgi:2-(1,2-epoxy-1,2-dihydrophenyl)acetyl-CoA isomerase
MLLAETFDARAALDVGLVNWVVEDGALGAETARIAQRLAGGASRALAETRQLVDCSFERTLAEQLEAEVEAFARCSETRDFAEGVTAFVEKRKPVFKGD